LEVITGHKGEVIAEHLHIYPTSESIVSFPLLCELKQSNPVMSDVEPNNRHKTTIRKILTLVLMEFNAVD